MISLYKRFLDFCGKENRRKFNESIVLGVFLALFEALKIPAIAVILRDVIDRTVTNRAIAVSVVIMLISILGQGFIRYFSTMLQTEGGYTACADKRIEIAEHLRYLPMGYFNNNSLGYITSVTTNTMETLSDIATRVVMLVSSGILTTALINIMLYFFDARIGFVVTFGLVIYFFVNSLMQKRSARISKKKLACDSVLVDRVIEYIKGIAEVKSYHLMGRMSKKLNVSIKDCVDTNIQMEVLLIPLMLMQSFITKMIGVATAFLSVVFYLNGSMELLNCMVMVTCSFIITTALETAGNYSALLKVVDSSITKAKEILELPPMDIEGEDVKPASYDIEAENIEFSYGKKKIIDGISLKIPQNTTTAVVGPSGGGKTTLCHLLSRFWDVDNGRITLGGKDIKEYSMDSLMKNFSFVFQNVTLFHDTVANNIRFGQNEAPMEKVIEAAKKARCHEFIMSLPEGYETVIGEDGGSLSGGERQRISIARAIMKDSPIIILDEATANVDPENEKELMEAIKELTQNKTIIMIAHRLKTVQKADQILVIDEGRIAERGTDEELIKNNGIYKRFIDSRKKASGWKI